LLLDEVREGLLGWMGDDTRRRPPWRWSHQVVITIDGLARLTASRATARARVPRAADGDLVQTGDPSFDRVVTLRGTRALSRALFDATARREVGALIGGHLSFASSGQEQTLRAYARMADGTLRVVVSDGRNHELVLGPLLALARRLVEPPNLAERIAEHTAREPLPAVRLGNLQVLIDEFRDHRITHRTLVSATHDPAGEVRLLAATALGDAGTRTLFKLALGRSSKDAHASEAIALLGSRFLTRHARWALRRAIPAGRTAVVTACVERLVTVDLARTAAAVQAALWSDDDEVAAAAGRALEKASAGCLEGVLVAALDHRLSAVQCRAALALGRVGSVASFASLRDWEARHLGNPGTVAIASGAIAALRARLSGRVSGELSMAGAEAGQVSFAKEDRRGAVSLGKPESGPT